METGRRKGGKKQRGTVPRMLVRRPDDLDSGPTSPLLAVGPRGVVSDSLGCCGTLTHTLD